MTVGGVTVYTETAADAAATVTAAEIDGGLTANASALAAAGITYTGTAAAGTLAFSKADGTDFTVAITSNFATAAGSFATGAFTGAHTNGTETVPAATNPYTLASTTIQVGTAAAVDVAGTYATAEDLVNAINSKVSGAYASIDASNHLVISSGEALTLGGAGATALGVASAALGGSLNVQNVKTTADANTAIQSVDAAMTSVSSLRSTLGAIQNRFQSVINSLQAVSENLSASRSRILDTDFAAETASLTRAQILQQAGTAMVAQANSAPQNVLSLLRG